MGKDLNGKELGKGICQRKDGRYSFRGTIDSKRYEYNAHTLSDILAKKKEFNNRKKRLNILDDSRYIYFISDGQYCKIGYTLDIDSRIKELQTGTANNLKLLYSFKTFDYSNIENQLHNLFKNKHINGEWYDILNLFQ